jgi:glucan phosphorylase
MLVSMMMSKIRRVTLAEYLIQASNVSNQTSSAAMSRGTFAPLRDTLLTNGDFYMHLADLQAYLDADARLCNLWNDPHAWARKVILNVASSGQFSSDRTIGEYASEIWKVVPCPLP